MSGNETEKGAAREQPPLGEAFDNRATNDEMIENADIDESERILQPPRDQLIGPRGLGNAAWVVMRENDRRRVVRKRPLDDFARVNTRAIDCAAKHLLACNDAMSVVEIKAREDLMLEPSKAHHQILARNARLR